MDFGPTTSCVRTVDLIRNTSELSCLDDEASLAALIPSDRAVEAFHFLDCNLYVRSLILETTSKVFGKKYICTRFKVDQSI